MVTRCPLWHDRAIQRRDLRAMMMSFINPHEPLLDDASIGWNSYRLVDVEVDDWPASIVSSLSDEMLESRFCSNGRGKGIVVMKLRPSNFS